MCLVTNSEIYIVLAEGDLEESKGVRGKWEVDGGGETVARSRGL